jgi:hypothetical protein
MTDRQAWLSVGLVALVALVARLVAAAAIGFPQPEDTAYYVGVARNLLEGRGLVSDAIWSYNTPPLEFPRPAFEVWLPLPTFLALLPMALAGISAGGTDLVGATRPAQVVSVVAGVLVCVLAWRLAADVARERGLPAGRSAVLALGTGLTCAVYLPLVLHSALPDSTMVFGAIVLAACLLMWRVLADPRGARAADPRVLGIGLLLGLGALTRNEAVWLAIVWAGLVATSALPRGERVRLVGVAAAVAIVVFAPWAIRDWLAFGSPFPGQAVDNALSIRGTDIFAWADPPTLSRYLDQGLAAIARARVDGLLHNLLNVLLYLGVPLSIVGLVALPWTARGAVIRPLLLYSVVTFLIAGLLFPVSTTWGTFLHAAGAIQVLVVLSALLALDGAIAWVGRKRGWTRPVAWLGATFAVAGTLLFSAVLLPAFGIGAADTERRYEAIGPALAEAGVPLEPGNPVITDFPIWLAETWRQDSLALPDEPPDAVLDLAASFPGTGTVLTFGGLHSIWFEAVDGGAPGAECFEEVDIPTPADPADAAAIADARAWRVVCP